MEVSNMKLLQIRRDDLLRPLQSVAGIVERRHTLPILSNVLIHCRRDAVSLVATDLEIQISTAFPANGAAEEHSLTVSARKLQDILRALPEESDVQLDVQNNRLQVKAGRSRFNLQILPAADFPALAAPADPPAQVHIPQKQLRELLHLVQYSMAQQDIRYYLNGLLLAFEDDQIRMVATDGHRLSYAAGAIEGKHEKREVILPRKAVQELVKLLADEDEDVEVQIYASQVRFRFGGIELLTKVIDGKFPDYTRVIPTSYQKQISLERTTLQQALQRAAILSNEKFRGVRWMLTANSLRISCTNNEQEEAQEELEVSYSADALDVGFNVTYLLDVLNNVQGERVVCAFGDANSSMLMTLPDRPDFRYVVMPMRI
jgi:DNA polymerase-3 subunit beta